MLNGKNAITLILAGVLLSACAGAKIDSGASLERASNEAAEAALRSGDPGQAAIIYEKQYERSPDALVATKEARALRLAGNPQQAVLFLQKASKKFPNNGQLLTELARSSLAGGYMPEALDALTRASNAPGRDWSTWLVYGSYFARNRNFDLARQYFNRAVVEAPTSQQSLSAQADLAILTAEEGDLPSAISQMTEINSRPGASPLIGKNLEILRALENGPPSTRLSYSYVRNRYYKRVIKHR